MRGKLCGAEHHMLANRECPGVERAGGCGGTLVGVHAHRRQVEAERRFERRTRIGFERLTGVTYRILRELSRIRSNRSFSGRRARINSRWLPTLHPELDQSVLVLMQSFGWIGQL